MAIAHRPALVTAAIIVMGLASAHTVGYAGGQSGSQRTHYVGEPLFTTYCATCHGTSAKGDGPFAASLRKRPPDLTQLAKLNDGKFPAERVTKAIDGRDADKPHGPSDMPVWGDAFSRTTHDSDPESVRQKIEAIVKYLESLQERPTVEPSHRVSGAAPPTR
jgi:mono/diheme cytochrome c family protein